MALPKVSQLLNLIPAPYRIAAGVGGLILGIVLIFGVLRSCDKRHDDANANLVNQGAVIEQTRTQSETINAVEISKEVTTHPSQQQLDRVCARYDRNCHN